MITVVIPTSPMIIHPSTAIIDKTIESVKQYLPDSRIMITFDGVRGELEHHRKNYDEYKKRMLEKYGEEINLVMFTNHEHQSGMLEGILDFIKTDQIFYLEHDWQLTREIPFKEMSETIRQGTADLIRLLYSTELPPYHMYLMIDQKPQLVNSIPLVRTFQWSQNPHLASTGFYKGIFKKYFDIGDRVFIEEKLAHPIVQEYRENGWGEFKTFIYCPTGNTQRCVHLDARKGENQSF